MLITKTIFKFCLQIKNYYTHYVNLEEIKFNFQIIIYNEQ